MLDYLRNSGLNQTYDTLRDEAGQVCIGHIDDVTHTLMHCLLERLCP